MARMTKKLKSAMIVIRRENLTISRGENSEIYEQLNNKNYFWNSKSSTWEKKEHAPSTSVFQADDGTPTGIGKIRLMAHPDDLPELVKALKTAKGIRVIEISEKTYPNRKGTGERIYTTVVLS